MTITELRTRRQQARDDFGANRRHVLADLRKPSPEIANLPRAGSTEN